MIYKVDLAGHELRFRLREKWTRFEFGAFLKPCEGEEYDVYADDARMARFRAALPEGVTEHYVEFHCLMGASSLKLIEHGRCLFHAVALEYRGRAWLLTAASGVGKTTQLKNFMRLFPGEASVICGDMPVIEARDDGSVWVHASPWNGKERISGLGNAAELGGMIFLAQAKENALEELSPRDAVMPVFRQFTVRPENKEQIELLAKLTERVCSAAPTYLFRNLGDDASTAMLKELFDKLRKGE